MNKRIISVAVSIAMTASLCAGLASPAYAEAKTPQYQARSRRMEKLNRGLIAVKTSNGVYLSWRALGDESLEKQAYDIYRDGIWLETIDGGEATCWTDPSGTAENEYVVVKENEDISKETPVKPMTNTEFNYSYMDVPVDIPENTLYRRIELKDKNGKHAGYGGGINDASVGDLDGDGDYEIVLKWDPNNSKDAASGGTTGRVYLDGYEISDDNTNSDGNGHLYKWRIDLGPHVRAGAHETPFLVYDFDGDGCSEIVSLTGPGAIDGTGKYVTEVGDTEEIRNYDNNKLTLSNGKNVGVEFYTIFDGKTGAALWTTEAILIGRTDGKDWGKNTLNESQRYLAAVAYLDGVHPSLVMCRGYYYRAALRAYTWDGSEMTMQWEYDCGQSGIQNDSLYRQGNHNLSVGDIDGDGRDEIVYGSAALDDDGITVLGNTKLGHGDAMHLSDFNNDGKQEVMSVKEHEMKKCAENFRDALTGQSLHTRTLTSSSDNGRGIMDNLDDEYAKTNPNALAISWSSGFAEAHDLNGEDIGPKAGSAARSGNTNFLIYWDDDLGRELLDTNIICKYHAPNGNIDRLVTFDDVTANNSTKSTPTLSADLWGDWREEVIFGVNDTQEAVDAGKQPAMRIFTSNIPTQYRLTTLMHDSQYRLGIAWQNIAYNQPPHTSYYVGSAALATDSGGNELNYLAPAVPYTKVVYEYSPVDATGITLDKSEVSVERTKTTRLIASAEPADTYPIDIKWKSSDENIATVEGGVVKGIADGEATITATVNGGPSADCKVTVYTNHADGVTLSPQGMDVGVGKTANLTATVTPDNTTDKSVTWSSDNERVAKVDKNGVVKGISDGTATITATTVDGGFAASCVVNVYPLVTADVTDDTEFKTVNTDANTTITNTATSSVISQKNAESGAMVERVFQSYPNDKVRLSFRVVTGGQRLDGSTWNWSGHEYTLGLKFLDTQGNSILDILQAWTSGAQATQSAVMGGSKKNISGDWKQIVSDGENPLGRSTTRWEITFELDYRNDTCTATLAGADSNWTLGQTYQKSFALNGAKFEKLQLYTQKDGSGTITAVPDLSQIKYTRTIERGPRNSIKLTGVEGKKANLSIIYQDTYESVDLIGVLYDSDGKLVELQPKTVENTPVAGDVSEAVTDFIEFERDINDYDLKVFMWDSLSGVTPLCAHDEKKKE